jgi:hypothetical protein
VQRGITIRRVINLTITACAFALFAPGAVSQAMADNMVQITGQLHIQDDDWPDGDETFDGPMPPFAAVMTAGGASASLLAGWEPCADEVIVGVQNGRVTARADRRIEVSGVLTLWEFTRCGNAKQDLDGQQPFTFIIAPGLGPVHRQVTVSNTNEGGDWGRLHLDITNFPL